MKIAFGYENNTFRYKNNEIKGSKKSFVLYNMVCVCIKSPLQEDYIDTFHMIQFYINQFIVVCFLKNFPPPPYLPFHVSKYRSASSGIVFHKMDVPLLNQCLINVYVDPDFLQNYFAERILSNTFVYLSNYFHKINLQK